VVAGQPVKVESSAEPVPQLVEVKQEPVKQEEEKISLKKVPPEVGFGFITCLHLYNHS